jgi:signal transduction histidine kinase
MNTSGTLRQQLILWGLILGLWALLVLAFAGQLLFTTSLSGTQALALSLRDWSPWVLLAPLVAWLAFRFPLERHKLLVSIPVHVLACTGIIVGCQLVGRPSNPPPDAPQSGGLRPFPPRDRPMDDGPPFPPGPGRPGEFPPDRFDGPPELLRPGAPEGRRGDLFLNSLVLHGKFHLPIYWVVVSIAHAARYLRRSQERERAALELEARLADARLQALRMQLHPHFLFNTLHAISTLVHKDPKAADEMIGNLSELLRVTLDTSERQEVPLRQELDFLDRYLEIQQVRFGDRLRIEKQIDAAALDAQVPTLILQPLVENSIRHGLEPHPAPGVVAIQATRRDDTVCLVVQDNGVGARKAADNHEGIGLANTRARLQELYGQRARLTLSSASSGGFRVDIELPYREEQ